MKRRATEEAQGKDARILHVLSPQVKRRSIQYSDPDVQSHLDYKTHLMSDFTIRMAAVAEDYDFQDLVCDAPELKALFRAFRPDECGFRPHTLVLHGRQSIGRSKLVHRLLLGWVQGEALQDLFSYVFLLQARDLQGVSESSFLKLLSRVWPAAPEAAQDMGVQLDRLLFMLDSFDDLDWTSGDEDGPVCADWDMFCPVKVLLRSLLRKVLLPEASLLITASNTSLEMLSAVLVAPCYLWLGGLSVEQRLDPPQEQNNPEAEEREVPQWVTHYQLLQEWCSVPEVKELLEEALNLQPASLKCTLTVLYATWVFHQLTPPREVAELGHCQDPEWRHMLQALCQLALQGVMYQTTTFSRNDLEALKLWTPHLHTLVQERFLVPLPYWEDRYSFMHSSLQDFFAALSYLFPEGKGWLAFPELPSMLLTLPGGGNLQSINQFLCGLLNPEVVKMLEDLLEYPGIPEYVQALMCTMTKLGSAPDPQDLLSAFYRFYETQDKGLVWASCGGLQEARLQLSQSMDLIVCVFCLPLCEHVQTVQLCVQGIFQRNPSLEAENTLPTRMQSQNLIRENWQQLCLVLSLHPSLRQLDLMGSVLSQWAMKTLCKQLQRPDCAIQRLNFKDTQVKQSLHYLWRVLLANSRLQFLGLDCMPLRHKDVTMAGEALLHPSCRITSLRLEGCGLEGQDFSVISEVLAGTTCLQSLSLARNNVSEAAFQELCGGLLSPTCMLQRLVLRSCGLSFKACETLAKALDSSHRVTHLDLSDNPLGTCGVRRMYPTLTCSTPGLGVQRLLLNWCNLDITACSFLAMVLMGHTSLTHLSLSSNPLGNGSIKLLCQALQHPTCHLKELELVRCQLTAACCSNLSPVIAKSKHLSCLDLSHNDLGNEGLEALCEGLKQDTSSLTKLSLETCNLTSESSKVLSTALSHNRSLLSLNLAGNSFNLLAMKTLCWGIAHQSCALRVIKLNLGQFPTEVQQPVEELQQVKPSVVVDRDFNEEPDEEQFWWQQ